MSTLFEKHCTPCEGGTTPLSVEEAQALLAEVTGWQINEAGNKISRTFSFKNYYHTMAFANALAFISHRENHHPDLEIYYNRCVVHYTTHAIGGLSQNDFICASKVDALMAA